MWGVGGADSIEGMWGTIARMDTDCSWTKYTMGGVFFSNAVFLPGNGVMVGGSIATPGHEMPRSDRHGLVLYSEDGGFHRATVFRNTAPEIINALAVAEYLRCFDAETIRATCEEFRAAATIDLVHDEADKEHKISCPTLLLWSGSGMWANYDILEIWRARAKEVQGVALDCGHFLPEESPRRTAAELIRFLS